VTIIIVLSTSIFGSSGVFSFAKPSQVISRPNLCDILLKLKSRANHWMLACFIIRFGVRRFKLRQLLPCITTSLKRQRRRSEAGINIPSGRCHYPYFQQIVSWPRNESHYVFVSQMFDSKTYFIHFHSFVPCFLCQCCRLTIGWLWIYEKQQKLECKSSLSFASSLPSLLNQCLFPYIKT